MVQRSSTSKAIKALHWNRKPMRAHAMLDPPVHDLFHSREALLYECSNKR